MSRFRRAGGTGVVRRWAVGAAALLACAGVAAPAYAAPPSALGPTSERSVRAQGLGTTADYARPFSVRRSTARTSGTRVAGAADGPQGTFSFTFDSDAYPWSADDLATLRSWTTPGSAPLAAVQAIVGRPARDVTINIVRSPDAGAAGYYGSGQLTLRTLRLDVFVHELNHAVHDQWVLPNSVWEEGMARAAEDEELRLLALGGEPILTGDPYHRYDYDQFYDSLDRPDLGVQDGSIFGRGEPALALVRYQSAGYAFGKALIENPQFMVGFNRALLARDPAVPPIEADLVAMGEGASARVEGLPFATWVRRQGVLDATPPTGCRMFQRTSGWTADFFCRTSDGNEVPQADATVTYAVYDARGQALYFGRDVTGSYGWTAYGPTLGTYTGRVKIRAVGTSSTGRARSTFYRPALPPVGLDGVVVRANTGTVTIAPTAGEFAPVTVPVVDGAFSAPGLASFRGTLTVTFRGEKRTATRVVTKAESPYAVELVAR